MDELTRDLEVYLVGGAVRDEMLGIAVKDRDYVVVGAEPATLAERGFLPVGRDFPVFLHPVSKEQYALARTERKTAPGYHGFRFDASAEVTLEQDLQRRDLTVNAMARDAQGRLVDPFGGARDLQQRLLRHVSPAFAEDPVRVLRVARFAARLHRHGFRIADDTMALMRHMVTGGEVDALVPERVWAELEGALSEPTPSQFVEVLRECGALARVMPELDRLFGVPQPPAYHPEIDTGVHTLLAVDMAATLSEDTMVRFAALVHDLGKGETPRDELPRHVGHEKHGVAVIETLCERLRVPRRYRELAVATCLVHLRVTRMGGLRPGKVLETLETIDAFRRPERVQQVALACEADARGRTGLQERPYPQRALMQRCFDAAAAVNTADIAAGDHSGAAIGEAIRERRIEAVRRALQAS